MKRENNYDLLRIISAVAVITLHVSGTWISAITDKNIFGEFYTNGMLASCIYNVISRFAVPCFIMLSGAFILADERNASYRYFYRKTFVNIYIPTFIFSILYCLFFTLLALRTAVISGSFSKRALLQPTIDMLKGVPAAHLWYLYMMIGVYLLVPVLISVKKQLGEKAFCRIPWALLVVSSIGYLTSRVGVYWDLGCSVRFVGYFMLGYVLRSKALKNKNGKKGALYISLGVAAEAFIIYLRYLQASKGISDGGLKYQLVAPLAPLVIIASSLIFAGFSHITVKKNLSKMSSLTFYIYLIHFGVWTVLSKLICKFGFDWDNRIAIPAAILLVLVVSVILSKIYALAWNALERKFSVSDKLCRILRLQQSQ